MKVPCVLKSTRHIQVPNALGSQGTLVDQTWILPLASRKCGGVTIGTPRRSRSVLESLYGDLGTCASTNAGHEPCVNLLGTRPLVFWTANDSTGAGASAVADAVGARETVNVAGEGPAAMAGFDRGGVAAADLVLDTGARAPTVASQHVLSLLDGADPKECPADDAGVPKRMHIVWLRHGRGRADERTPASTVAECEEHSGLHGWQMSVWMLSTLPVRLVLTEWMNAAVDNAEFETAEHLVWLEILRAYGGVAVRT